MSNAALDPVGAALYLIRQECRRAGNGVLPDRRGNSMAYFAGYFEMADGR
jgi:hypothetical protein